MTTVMPDLREESHSTSVLGEDKFHVLLQSQQGFLRQFGGLQEGIEASLKADLESDSFLLDNDAGSIAEGLLSKAISDQKGFGIDFKASSFFTNDEDSDDSDYENDCSFLDRPTKKPRLDITDAHDEILKEQLRSISRSVLGQLVDSSAGDEKSAVPDTSLSISNNDANGDRENADSSVDNVMSAYKEQRRRLSLSLLNQTLQRRPDIGSKEFEPLSLFREDRPTKTLPPPPPSQTLVLGAYSISLATAINRSQQSQRDIQDWDRKMGLKRSHSRTMSLSSKSRKRVLALLKGGTAGHKWTN